MSPENRDKSTGQCTVCKRAACKRWQAKTPRKRYRWEHLKPKYGITKEDHDKMLYEQGNRCAICSCMFGEEVETVPHVDHDHVTKKVRGLLCKACNTGLGQFKDNVTSLQRAVLYLQS
jgi:hypothetical protein